MSHTIQEDISLNVFAVPLLNTDRFLTYSADLSLLCAAAGRVTHEQQRWPVAGANDSAVHDQDETEHAVISIAPWFPVVCTHT